jgi:hypothetical protein
MINLRRRIIPLALAIAAAAPTLARAGQSTERSAVAPAQAAPSSEIVELSDSNVSRTLSEIISKPPGQRSWLLDDSEQSARWIPRAVEPV